MNKIIRQYSVCDSSLYRTTTIGRANASAERREGIRTVYNVLKNKQSTVHVLQRVQSMLTFKLQYMYSVNRWASMLRWMLTFESLPQLGSSMWSVCAHASAEHREG